MFLFSPERQMSLEDFRQIVEKEISVGISPETVKTLNEVREFIQHLCKENAVVYGLTTGFADLRNKIVSAEKGAELSLNLIRSHDAGIGQPLAQDIVLGAMAVRANALAKGYSGFQAQSLTTLVEMINARIIPEIPACGSLGASGDLALLARLGRAMCGEEVPVFYQGQRISAKEALRIEKIRPFFPANKEGLALTNGTSFMASMGALAAIRQLHLLENICALQPLFLEAVQAVDAAFASPVHSVRGQIGQSWMAEFIYEKIKDSARIDRKGTQNDYCIRCIPQILGPKLDLFLSVIPWIEQELNAVTDNPLIFKGGKFVSGLAKSRIFDFQNEQWAVLSGGNFHGEYSTTAADCITVLNAKIALMLERQMTYMLNPFRNNGTLPIYLIAKSEQAGLHSGYMITQYTANDLAQRIAAQAHPTSMFNLTSANESEDVVSYGSTACQKLLTQIDLFEDFLAIYTTTLMQAYSLNKSSPTDSYGDTLFHAMQNAMEVPHPFTEEKEFSERYQAAKRALSSNVARKASNYPLTKILKEGKSPATELFQNLSYTT